MAAEQIEQLEIEIQSDSTKASSSIDALADSLGRLKTALKGGAGLTSVTQQLSRLNAALSNLDAQSGTKLKNLANGLSALSRIGKVSISGSLANNITNIGAAIDNLEGVNMARVTNLASALNTLSSVGRNNLSSTTRNLQAISQLGYQTAAMDAVSESIPRLTNALSALSQVGSGHLRNITTRLTELCQIDDAQIDQLSERFDRLSTALAPLAQTLQTVSDAFVNLPQNIRRLVTATNAMSQSNSRASGSFLGMFAKVGVMGLAVHKVGDVLGEFIAKSTQYIEDVNLFTVALGDYAGAAQEYADKVSDIMGIDPGEWMRNQGTFMTLATGFGVASDRAYTMSQNLTQLGYDISSFFNLSFEESMAKVQSGLAGELEPLRRIGWDLSVARLQQEAYTLGINKKVSAMTQAEKAELRYYAIMTQVTTAQGDMARTLDNPANQLRILKAQLDQCSRAMGNLFIPMLNKVLPYLIAVAKVVKEIVSAIAGIFGFTLSEVDYGGAAVGAGALADNLGAASDAAKKLKKNTIGIDELNIISNDDNNGSGSGADTSGGGLGFELPTYDFLGDATNNRITQIVDKMKEWLGITKEIKSWSDLYDTKLGDILAMVSGIATGIAGWKVSQGLIQFVESMKGLNGLNLTLSGLGTIDGLFEIFKFTEYLEDFLTEGGNIYNISGMLTSFIGVIGDAAILAGNTDIGGLLKLFEGVGQITGGIVDILDRGVNWENAGMIADGIGNLVMAFGLLTGQYNIAGIGMALKGIKTLIENAGDVIEAIRTKDWSGVDKTEVAMGLLEAFGGLVIAFGAFSKIKSAVNTGQTVTDLTDTASTIGQVNTTVSTGVNPKLKELATNLAWGLLILLEVAAAAVLVVGAIALVGYELQLVADTWTPVIEQRETVLTALGAGALLMTAVGGVCYGLGTVGETAAANIGIGMAVMVEVSAATDLFVAEIIILGMMLSKVAEEWQPVINNKETVLTALATGTALILAVGTATAALGVLTVVTGGYTIPAAIAIGTALLMEMSAATDKFVEELGKVAKSINEKLAPQLSAMNKDFPTLNSDMDNFTKFMESFGNAVGTYAGSTVISGLADVITTIIGWFADDPIESFADDVKEVYDQTAVLNEKLKVAVPELETAKDLMTSYDTYLTDIEDLLDNDHDLSKGTFINMQNVGENLVTGFVTGIQNKASDFENAAMKLITGFKAKITSESITCLSTMTTWANNLKTWFIGVGYGEINDVTWQGYGKDLVTGFKTGISVNYTSCQSDMIQWSTSVKDWFEKPGSKTLVEMFEDIGKNIIQGFIDGSSDSELWQKAKRTIQRFADEIIDAAMESFDEASPSKVFKGIGGFVIEGFNIGVTDAMQDSFATMQAWCDGVNEYVPSLMVDTSKIGTDLSGAVLADVQNGYTVTNEGFADSVEIFYKEYVEPTLLGIATDTKRQADKNEQTIVKIGNRTITDAVTTQQRANGYSFVRG